MQRTNWWSPNGRGFGRVGEKGGGWGSTHWQLHSGHVGVKYGTGNAGHVAALVWSQVGAGPAGIAPRVRDAADDPRHAWNLRIYNNVEWKNASFAAREAGLGSVRKLPEGGKGVPCGSSDVSGIKTELNRGTEKKKTCRATLNWSGDIPAAPCSSFPVHAFIKRTRESCTRPGGCRTPRDDGSLWEEGAEPLAPPSATVPWSRGRCSFGAVSCPYTVTQEHQ